MHTSVERVHGECSTGSTELDLSKALTRQVPPALGWARIHCKHCQTIGELPVIK